MKKLILFMVMVLFSAASFANGDGDFVKTEEGTFFFKKVRSGIKCCLVGIKENGEKVQFKKSEIISFSLGGKQFEKMPVYKSNQATGDEDFMQLVCYRNGMKLYEYEYTSKASNNSCRRYYVFKGDKFVVEMDNMNKPTLTAFFKGEN
jgi:hypothetical protein